MLELVGAVLVSWMLWPICARHPQNQHLKKKSKSGASTIPKVRESGKMGAPRSHGRSTFELVCHHISRKQLWRGESRVVCFLGFFFPGYSDVPVLYPPLTVLCRMRERKIEYTNSYKNKSRTSN